MISLSFFVFFFFYIFFFFSSRRRHTRYWRDWSSDVCSSDLFLLNVTALSSNQTLVPTTNIIISGFGTNRTATITPAPNQNGSGAIRLTVSDGTTNASTSFTLTVNPVNDPPTLDRIADINGTSPAGNATFSQTVSLTGIGTGATNETQTLTVTAYSSNTSM